MALSKRERHTVILLSLVLAVVAVEQILLSPYLAWRGDVIARCDTGRRTLLEGRVILDREHRLRELLARLGANSANDASTVEGRLLTLVHDWEQQAGVGGASFHRVRLQETRDFSTMSFQISATGSMPAVARLLYSAETAPIPLRVDDMQLAPKGDNGDELTIQMTVSTLYRKAGQGAPAAPALPPSSQPSVSPPQARIVAANDPVKEAQ